MCNNETRKRVLYVITRAEHGGAQAHVLSLLRSFHAKFEVALSVGETGFLTAEAKHLGIPVFQVPHLAVPIRPGMDLRALYELSLIIRDFKPDLIHAHSSKAGLLARLAARLHRIPCIFTAHGWAFSDGASEMRKRIAVISERAVARLRMPIVTVSQYDYNLALRQRIGDPSHMITIRNGIDDLKQSVQLAECTPPVIAMVARFSPPKDHLALLRALAQIHAPFRLWFVGDGPLLERARCAAADLGLEDRTVFLGDRDDVPTLLAKSHIFVLISRHEGLPISILEAMRAGLPIVASNVGGIPELVKNGKNGILVDRDNHEALVNALQILLKDPDLRKTLGNCSRILFEKDFTLEAMVGRTLELYEQHLAPKRGVIGRIFDSHEASHRTAEF